MLTRPDWLAARRTGIGASDAAAILGKDPFRSALAVYQSKVAPQPDEWRWEFARGIALEDVIARQFAADHPEIVVDPIVRGIYNHPEHEWLMCTPDRILRRPTEVPPFGVLEMKTWSGRAWRDWAEGVPLHIQIQVQHQLLVSGFGEAWVSVSIGGDPPEHYHVEANERFHRVLVPVLAEFWLRVQERRPPEADGSEASREAIAALWPREANGKVVSLPAAFSMTDEHRELLKAEIAERKAELDEIDNRIRAAMGDAESAVLDNGVQYTLKHQTRKAYMIKESSFRVLRRKAAE